jgi:hypothetical protein
VYSRKGWAEKGWAEKGWAEKGRAEKGWAVKGWAEKGWADLRLHNHFLYAFFTLKKPHTTHQNKGTTKVIMYQMFLRACM